MTDTIHVQGIRCYGYIGLLPEEQVLGQWFEVNLTLWVDLTTAGKSDQIQDTVDYRQAIALTKQLISQEKFALVEKLAQAIADAVLTIDLVEQVRVQLIKVSPPIPDFGGSIVIDIKRAKNKEKLN
ncbi:MAG: dihydroneopterin aldolase [Snowella sp.]|nr:dihydroneopterin aldolase [Snowella sp.]